MTNSEEKIIDTENTEENNPEIVNDETTSDFENLSTLEKVKLKATAVYSDVNKLSDLSNKEKISLINDKSDEISEIIGTGIDNFFEKLFKRKKK